ncbi:MAG: hypothetical protein COW03_00560 [Cytophagales bacterium CG12_big_fil_rev_8_21_14_0_65_40_12]|nr:MAG: hypothetical protein COW03_00560 [Cytophagales bacterium CG12_big_fil_rev_8_21_14_0_65_40_12]PIW05418.1 MAG: hypothetical protein COW40_04945 [Cytophagales bacterium CG17_big_fil_post_rev_8_21_14_2_50_40_13]
MKRLTDSNFRKPSSILYSTLITLCLTLFSSIHLIAQTSEGKKETTISISTEKLTSYTGDYEMNPGSFLKILLVNDTLKAQGPGSPAMELIPLTENRFFLKVFGVDIAFVGDSTGKIEKLLMIRDDGQTLEAKKVIKKDD